MRAHFIGLLTLGVATVICASIAGADEQPSRIDKPQIVAVKFHADWCGSCRKMGSVFEDLTIVSEDEPVLFLKLDLTDSRARKQAAYLMTMLGLQEPWAGAGAGQKTGFILLIDPATQQRVGQLTADQDLKQMKAALLDAIAKGRS